MKEIDKLKQMAAPNSERIAVAVEANTVLLQDICNYKKEQKEGDIKHRKISSKQNKQSILLSIVSITIACAAFYISIVGLDAAIVLLIKEEI